MMQFTKDLIRLRTDFNDATEDEATSLIEGLHVALFEGDPVELFDADGNSVYGVVSRIANELVYVAPDWESWHEAPEVDLPATDFVELLFQHTRASQVDRLFQTG